MNKKGNIADWFLIMTILFASVIMLFVVYSLTNNASLNKVFDDNNVQTYTQGGKKALLSMDNMFMFMLVGLSLFVLISSALVHNHPAMFFFSLFFLTLAVVFGAIISNAFYDTSTNTYFTTYRASFPKIVFLMENMPMYIAFMGIAALVAGYVGYRNL